MTSPLSHAIQEYLESLYWLHEAGIDRTPTNLARAMQVSPPSVTEMVRKLELEGLVERGPGKRISLTAKGDEVARHVVSRHRLVEAFLVKVMGVPWDEVHEEAETFEMGVTESLEARMLGLIGDAKTCPHGHPIGDYPREPGEPLPAVPSGSAVVADELARTVSVRVLERGDGAVSALADAGAELQLLGESRWGM